MAASPTNNRMVGGRREELIAVAARLFRERGYDATSMQEIADEVGILKGSLYHYVSTKEDLLWLITEQPLTELVQAAAEIFGDKSLPLVERMHRAITAHCESFEKHHPHMFVITREHGHSLSPPRAAELAALRDRYHELWKKAIVAGRRSGELRGDIDPAITTDAILGMINWMFRWFRPGGRVTAATVADQFAAILEQGVVAPAPAT